MNLFEDTIENLRIFYVNDTLVVVKDDKIILQEYMEERDLVEDYALELMECKKTAGYLKDFFSKNPLHKLVTNKL